MATRRMRIKATINVPRGGIKTEPQEQPVPTQIVPVETNVASQSPVTTAVDSNVPLSPRICPSPSSVQQQQEPADVPMSPGNSAAARSCTPPVSKTSDSIPSSPHSPSSWQLVQRPSPSKSPAGLPPSGSILRRSPSPALMSRLTNSPGPPPLSPVKSPIPSYASPHSPVKFISRTPVVIMPTSSVSLSGGVIRSSDMVYPTSSSPVPGVFQQDTNIKSPVNYLFRPPPSPSPSHYDFHSIKSPGASNTVGTGIAISRPSPAQSPVYAINRPPSNSSANFLTHHFNSNSNSADSHEVASLMGAAAYSMPSSPAPGGGPGLYPPSPEKRPHSSSGRDSASSRGSHGGLGAFSSVSSNVNPSPSFAKTMFENPEGLKKRSDDIRKKEGAQPNPTKFAAARKEFFDKLQSGQAPERSKLTMLHFTFYNPPDPAGSNKLTLAKRKSRSRASSICSDVSSITKLEKDEKNDENTAGKANSAPSSIAGSRRTTASSVASGGSCAAHSEAGSVASNASSESMPGPRVKVGPDGQLIIDEKSLVVETSESQRARQQIEDMEVVSGAEYAVGSSGFYRYKKNYRRGQDWTERETIRFYRALNQCGTDFSMMLNLFPHRTRQELKAKFKREDRRNPDMISKALASCIFDPDEGISSDEEVAIYSKGTEKERLLNEEKEVEEVICSTEDALEEPGKKKRKSKNGGKKKKDMEFSTVQMQEFSALVANTKGVGTGKGKKWNTPVEGLQAGKLPVLKKGTVAGSPLPFQPISKIKMESNTAHVEEKPKKKYTRKKKQPANVMENSSGSNSAGAVEIPGSAPKVVSIIIASGVISTPSSGESIKSNEIKEEKLEEPQKQQPESSTDLATAGGNKRRSRLPKTKPNVKRGGGGQTKEVAEDNANKSGQNSSQTSNKPEAVAVSGLCDNLFRFDDESDALGLKLVPDPLPMVEETDLIGNEEGSEGLVIVDLDELKSIQKESVDVNSTPRATCSTTPAKIKAPPKKRKNNSNTDGELAVGTKVARVITSKNPDPYEKSVMMTASSSGGVLNDGVGEEGNLPPHKKVKVLPYRVPGPGGTLSSTQKAPLVNELEIEIEMGTTSFES